MKATIMIRTLLGLAILAAVPCFAQTPEQLKKLKASPSDLVGTFEVQGQGISSYTGTGPTHTDCDVNYNT